MSEFDGKKVRAIGYEPIYDARDTESEFGPSVELADTAGTVILVHKTESFRADSLYEIVEE
jgi:hypothetical protein